MILDDYALIGIGALIALVYFVVGLGVGRMAAKINDREIRIFDVLMWWVMCCVFATTGKID